MNGVYKFKVSNIMWEKPLLDECDWHCDNCRSYLNDQEGFDFWCGVWKCRECGYENNIDEDNIIETLPDSEVVEVEENNFDIAYDVIKEYLEDKYNRLIDCLSIDNYYFECNQAFEDDYDYDSENDEGLSAYDAALIWISHGKDEDYMYGYTEDELEDALK